MQGYYPYFSPIFKINAGKKRPNLLRSFPTYYDSLVSFSILAKEGRMLRTEEFTTKEKPRTGHIR